MMLRSIVTPEMAPLVTIDVENGSGGFQSLGFIVATGFSDELAMPSDLIQRLGLPCADQTSVILADAREIQTSIYHGIVFWHGNNRAVRVIEIEGAPLLGMSFLSSSRLTVNARPGGIVLIEEDQELL